MATLSVAVESLLAQDFGDFELVIFDDCSDHATREALRALAAADPRIRLVLNEIRLGPWENFAHALKAVEPRRYFMWASQDDYWSPNWLSTHVARLETERFGAAFGRVIIVDEANQEIGTNLSNQRAFPYMQSRSPCDRRWRYALQPEYFGKGNAMYSLFRTDLLRSLHLFPTSAPIPLPYDFDIVRRFLARYPIACSPEATFYKRVHKASNGQNKPDVLPVGPISVFHHLEPVLPGSLKKLVRDDCFWVDRYLLAEPRVGPMERVLLEAKLLRTLCRGIKDRVRVVAKMLLDRT